jgi:streptogramin lyase
MGVSIGEGAAWVVMRGSALYRVDLTTRKVHRVPSVPAPVDVAARQGIVWVLDEQKGLVRLDARDGTIASPAIPVATRVGGDVYAAPGTVWIGNPATDTLIAFNADTNSFGAYFQLRGDYVDMAVLNSTVWVLTRDQQGNSLLTALDPRTGHELASPMSVAGYPVEISTDGHALWIAQRDANALLRVDPTTVLNH